MEDSNLIYEGTDAAGSRVEQLHVFVSHSKEDDAFCQTIVAALQSAGADVWYDEHNLEHGHLMEVIQSELGSRPVVVLILSKAAFASHWVKREMLWAYELKDRDPTRVILPITANPIAREDFDPQTGWLFLHDYKRIEASGYQPHPIHEAIRRLLHSLALTLPGDTALSTAPRPEEDSADVMARGNSLIAQKRYAEALPLFERATQLAPRDPDAWHLLGYTLYMLHRYEESLIPSERSIILDPGSPSSWHNKGAALDDLHRFEEALIAYDRALVLNPDIAITWSNKGNTFKHLKRYDEATDAYKQAFELDPSDVSPLGRLSDMLSKIGRYEAALEIQEQIVAFDPQNARSWRIKANLQVRLGQYQEARVIYDDLLALNPRSAVTWDAKANLLKEMECVEEALAACDQALSCRQSKARWHSKAAILRVLGRIDEADAAERHATERHASGIDE